MTRKPRFYRVPAQLKPSSLLGRKGSRLHARFAPWAEIARRYYDSADWGIHGAGWVLSEEAIGGQRTVSWRDRGSGRILASYPNRAAPRFPSELPPGPGRQQLEAVLEMRALLPVASAEGRQRSCALLDDRGKLVARLVQEQWQLSEAGWAHGEPNGDGRTLSRLQLIPLKGYEQVFDRLNAILDGTEGVEETQDDLYDRSLARAGRAPGDFSTKLDLGLDPGERADQALRRILARLLKTLEATEAGIAGDLDSEFLHDFRVAVRRARSALGEVRGVLPQARAEALRGELAWLGQATGPARDVDVYLLAFDDYRAALPPELRAELEPLRGFLRESKERQQAQLVTLLKSRRYGQLKADWRALAQEPPGVAAGQRAAEPIGSLALERIAKTHRRVLRRGRKISKDSPAEHLHQLRKDCKKLRYLLEFFRRLFAGKEIQALVKRLKALQDNLGGFQDCEAQAEQLSSFGRDMVETGIMQPGTQEALAHLIQALEARQLEVRKGFARCFASFDAKPVRKRFASLHATSGPEPPRSGAP